MFLIREVLGSVGSVSVARGSVDRGIGAKKHCRTHPSGASGIKYEAIPGTAHVQLRTPQAMLHFRKRACVWVCARVRAF
eukprot:15430583-Alexandrium_andersonii.AAC.1